MLDQRTASKTDSPSLYEPLIPSEKSPKMSIVERNTSIAKQKDYLAGRIYASNAPRIMLETITARTALIIIALTYIFFFIGFGLDFYTTYQGFNGSNKIIPAGSCEDVDHYITPDYTFWGCTNGTTWISTITDLTNVLSVKLNVQHDNITDIVKTMNNTFIIKYDVKLWACYNQYGCEHSFQLNNDYTDDPNVWQQVLVLNDQELDVNVARDDVDNDDGKGFNFLLIPNTFQNQESIPTNGLVRSYFVKIFYTYDPYELFTNMNTANDMLYYFNVVSRPKNEGLNVLTIILMIITVSVLIWYCYILYHSDKILSEQKWVVAYFLLLILFQNPDYSVIVFFKNTPTVQAAYTSYVIGYFAQSGLFILWLLFADSIKRKTTRKTFFYTPKIFIGLVIFTTGIVILTFQFPGLDPTTNRSAVQAVSNWSGALKNDFVAFTILYIVLVWTWTIMWFVQLIVTGRRLNKLPYMSTRYIQLSYRFFFLQATLVTVYYIFQYAAVVYYISSGTSDTNGNKDPYNPTSLTDNINTLFRQQTQLFGKVLFLTVYACIIAFFFLPANLGDTTGVITSLAATYVITESEHITLVRTRQANINKVKANLLNKVTRLNEIVNAKADVFCVDIAINLRNIAFQAYYDPPSVKTISGYEGGMDLDKIGFFLVDVHYNKDHEVFCFIAREKKTDRIVVAFRGTASKRQMEDNLNFTQRSIDFHNLNTDVLDQLDGLTIRADEAARYDDDDLESVDEEDDLAEQQRQHDLEEGSFRRSNSLFGRQNSTTGRESHDGADGDTHRETIMEKAGHVGGTVGGAFSKLVTGAVDATNAGIDAVVGLSTGVVVTAASKTPILKGIVKPNVHCGFWDAYSHVRDFVHAILRRELVKTPTTVFFTGHSLGGALATLASVDVSINTIPRVNAYLKHKQRQAYGSLLSEKKSATLLGSLVKNLTLSKQASTTNFASSSASAGPAHSPVHSPVQSPIASPAVSHDGESSAAHHAISVGSAGSGVHPSLVSQNSFNRSAQNSTNIKPKFVKKIKIYMYNYGSPRVGNTSFAAMFDKEVPRSYRVVVDGDLITGLPPSGYLLRGYQHIGTEIMIDNTGAGSIIIDPSFVERWLRTNTKSSVAAHSLLVYRKGLLGIKLCAEFMKQRAVDYAKDDIDADPLRLALKVRGSIHADQIFDETDGYAHEEEEDPSFRRSMQPSFSVDHTATSNINSTNSSANNSSKEGAPRLSNSSLIELKTSPSASAVIEEPPLPTRLLLQKQMSEQVIITPTEAKIMTGDLSPTVTKDMQITESKHYEHDLEQMESMMVQIKSLKRTGPIKWLKHKMISKKGDDLHEGAGGGDVEEGGERHSDVGQEDRKQTDKGDATTTSSSGKRGSQRMNLGKMFSSSSVSSSSSSSSSNPKEEERK